MISLVQLVLLGTVAFFATRTGLPRIAMHHVDGQGRLHCCCGCSCSQHPHAADSCLNPRNRHITCGCAKEHGREIQIPLPRLSPALLPAPPDLPRRPSRWRPYAPPGFTGVHGLPPALLSPPH